MTEAQAVDVILILRIIMCAVLVGVSVYVVRSLAGD